MGIDLQASLGAAESASTDLLTLYIPTRDRDGKLVDNTDWIKRGTELLCKIGGGATRLPPVFGAWQRDDLAIIEEEIILVYCFLDVDKFAKLVDDLRKFLHQMGHSLNQGEVVVEVSGRLYKIRDYD